MNPVTTTEPTPRWDAYLSYAEADREWVEERLAPRLEAAGRRLFLERDLPPGEVEIEARARAVGASRKTLVVVSRAYLDHRWAVLEEAVTHQLDPAARKRRLIPLLREDCEAPLRLRPLVAVDLRDGGRETQWRRLLEALDPQREADAALGLAQRWSLRLAEATAELARPAWHDGGVALLAAAYLALAAAAALGQLLLWEVAPLRPLPLLLVVLPAHALAALAWREDRDLFRRLSHLLGRSPRARGAVAALALAAAAAWWWAGVPAARAIVCGPLGCKEAGKTYLTVGDFDVLAPRLPEAASLTLGTRRMLEQKLGAAPGVAVLGQGLPHIDGEARRRLGIDYTISGQLEDRGGPVLTAFLFDHRLVALPPPVSVEGRPAPGGGGEAPEVLYARVHEIQDRLARELLARLGLTLAPEVAARLDRIPTHSTAAMAWNDEAFHLQRAGRWAEAEAKLRQALELDEGYSVAWSNLGEVAWRQGRYEEALEYRRAAVERLPTYAPFHYNLGHLLSHLGRDREALAALREAVSLDRAHVPAYNEMGNVLLRLGDPRGAAAALEKGLALEPGFAPLSKNLGRALLAAGDAAAAVAALERSLVLYPAGDWLGLTEAHALLLEARLRRGEEGAACRHLGELRRLDPQGVAPWSPAAEQAAAGLPCAAPRAEPSHAEPSHV